MHAQKSYKKETLFTAVSIFDRYLATIDFFTYPRTQVLVLGVISLLMGAKIEEPIAPSFNRMLGMLDEESQRKIRKEDLVLLEIELISVLGFDFGVPGPMQPLLRYLRLLDYHKNCLIVDMSYQICKFHLNDSKFLAYRPS